jgi:ubiquinone/menaquinone biosynthesis C-methylase UbiE
MSSLNSAPISDLPAQNWWERHIVPRLISCACAQPQIMKARSRIVPQAEGDVLELGCGGGINMEFYDPSRVKSLAGIDPSPGLLERTHAAAAARGMAADIRAGIGEAMPFEDARFDTVLVTFTLCSVQDQAQVLREIRRVLRPGGKALFLEHGRAPDASVQKWQNRIEPIWKRIGGGCHLTRPITGAYEAGGFKIAAGEKNYMPKTPRPFGWIEWGEARV